MTDEGIFALGDLPLHRGGVLPGAKLVWKTHGTLNAARDNVVLYPTSYGAQHPDLEWLIGPEGVLDPGRWFIVIPDMFGNGLSTSPSNCADWPALVTAWDNVRAQRRLLAEVFGVTRLHAVYGWSMGAQQAYHWAAAFPEAVERIVVNCGSARTAVHNRVFLQSQMAVLEAAPEYDGRGRFSAQPLKALRAFGRVYASWALSQDFYRANLHLTALGAPTSRPSSAPTGRSALPGGRRPTCWRSSAPGTPGTSATTRATAATWPGRSGRSRPGAAAALGDRPLLPGGGQRGGAAAPAGRGAAAHPQHLGPPRRQPAAEPAGCRLHRGGGAAAARQLNRAGVSAPGGPAARPAAGSALPAPSRGGCCRPAG
ncbi:alpha/beta fold hydrolase [Paeniroseomonas aquatica]|uniref:alpha/beta fold hydrolase n=1 Tax=Paeniroseomonas aquatica TaxID=373043 RepID=UPI003614556D